MLCSGGLPMFIVMLPNCVTTNDSDLPMILCY